MLIQIILTIVLVMVGCGNARCGEDAKPAQIAKNVSLSDGDEGENLRRYGVVCDGVTDDAPALNAALENLKAGKSRSDMTIRFVFPTGICLIRSTLNFTGLQSNAVSVVGTGNQIIAETNGTPAIDAMGSRWLKFHDVTIIGSDRRTPNIGIQIGRVDVTGKDSSDDHSFINLAVKGKFTFAAMYNFSAETTTFIHCMFTNAISDERSYTVVQDGLNHFGIKSLFLGQKAPIDTSQSFNENVFVGCDIRHYGGGTPLWLGDTSRLQLIRSYIAGTRSSRGVEVFSGQNGHQLLDLDAHFETNSLDSAIVFSGFGRQILRGFSVTDSEPQVRSSMLAVEGSIRGVTIEDINVRVPQFHSREAKLFSITGQWNVSGSIYLGQAESWVEPSYFTGMLQRGGVVEFRSSKARQ